MICDRVVFVDDDPDVRAANVMALELEGLRVAAFATAREGFAALSRDLPAVVVSDLRMPGEDGHALFRRVRALDPELPVILITGHADVAAAVQAMQDGAHDFVSKPYAPDRLLVSVRRALAVRALVLENRRLRASASRGETGDALLGDAPATRRLRAAVERIAGADVDVIIEGETGSGKETAARALHRASRRRGRFVVVDCADLDGDDAAGLFDAGPRGARGGRLEEAHRGHLFLRDVERLPDRLQSRLLRVLETGAVTAGLDDDRARPVDVRVVAATRTSLRERVEAGAFRIDLYHRLNGVTLHAPPLRDRREDLPLLFGRLLLESSRRLRTPLPALTAATLLRIHTHDWPGNMRELKAFADRVALGVPEPEALDPSGASLVQKVAAFEAELMRDALRESKGRVSEALKTLQLPRKTFYDKLAKHGLRPETFR